METGDVDPRHVRPFPKTHRPTRQQLIDTLIERHERGLSLKWRDVCCENFAFAAAVKSTFGIWYNALVVAGVPAPQPVKPVKWNRETVLAAIRSRYQQGLTIRHLTRDDLSLAVAARGLFGSLQEAAVAAGVEGRDG